MKDLNEAEEYLLKYYESDNYDEIKDLQPPYSMDGIAHLLTDFANSSNPTTCIEVSFLDSSGLILLVTSIASSVYVTASASMFYLLVFVTIAFSSLVGFSGSA